MKPVHVVLSDGVVVLRAVERSPDRFSDKQPHRLRGKEGGGGQHYKGIVGWMLVAEDWMAPRG